MIELLTDAIKSQDYQTAQKLLQQLEQQEPEHPWIPFYTARLAEARGDSALAGSVYRQLLQYTTNPKIISQARQGMGRIEAIEQAQQQEAEEERQSALTQAMTAKDSQEIGVLILEPMLSELKQAAAQRFAQIMQIDAYSARLQLPSRSWRLYKMGALGELRFYAEALNQGEIPCFCASLGDINGIKVYGVRYLEVTDSQVNAVYQAQKNPPEMATITFNWLEIRQRVEGLLPLFEECVEIGLRGKIERKTKTLDYAKMCDLHLPERNVIIRLCDQSYEFNQGIALAQGEGTNRDHWSHLTQFLGQQLPSIPLISDFTPFAETAMNFTEMLQSLEANIDFLRREETPWDGAFQLYSGLGFMKLKMESTKEAEGRRQEAGGF